MELVDEKQLFYAIEHNDVDTVNALFEKMGDITLNSYCRDIVSCNNVFYQLVVKDDVEQLKRWFNRPNLEITTGYILSIIRTLGKKKVRFNRSFRCLVEYLTCNERFTSYGLAYMIRSLDEDGAIEMMEKLDWDDIGPDTRKYFFLFLSKKNAARAVKVVLNHAPDVLKLVSPHRVLTFSPEIINLMLDKGWDPTRGRSVKVLEALVSKLNKSGSGDEAQQLRERIRKIIANKLAKELGQT